jgi:hypothetical protein
MSSSEDPGRLVVAPPLLRLEFGRSTSLMQAGDAGMLRDELRTMDSPAADRLAAQIDVVVTTLLAAPLHAGTRAVRVAKDEQGVLREAALILERQPSDGFAKLRTDLSGMAGT